MCVQACRRLNPGSRCREPWLWQSCSLRVSPRQHGDPFARAGATSPPSLDCVPAAYQQREKPAGVDTARYPNGCPCRAFPPQSGTARCQARSSGGPTMAWCLRPCGSRGLTTVRPAGLGTRPKTRRSRVPDPATAGQLEGRPGTRVPVAATGRRHRALGICADASAHDHGPHATTFREISTLPHKECDGTLAAALLAARHRCSYRHRRTRGTDPTGGVRMLLFTCGCRA